MPNTSKTFPSRPSRPDWREDNVRLPFNMRTFCVLKFSNRHKSQ